MQNAELLFLYEKIYIVLLNMKFFSTVNVLSQESAIA